MYHKKDIDSKYFRLLLWSFRRTTLIQTPDILPRRWVCFIASMFDKIMRYNFPGNVYDIAMSA